MLQNENTPNDYIALDKITSAELGSLKCTVFVYIDNQWKIGVTVPFMEQDKSMPEPPANASNLLLLRLLETKEFIYMEKSKVFLFSLLSEPFLSLSAKFQSIEISQSLLIAVQNNWPQEFKWEKWSENSAFYRHTKINNCGFKVKHEFCFGKNLFDQLYLLFKQKESGRKEDDKDRQQKRKKVKLNHDSDFFTSSQAENLLAREEEAMMKQSYSFDFDLFELFKLVWLNDGFYDVNWEAFVKKQENVRTCFTSEESFTDFNQISSNLEKIKILKDFFMKKLLAFETECYKVLERNRLESQLRLALDEMKPVHVLLESKIYGMKNDFIKEFLAEKKTQNNKHETQEETIVKKKGIKQLQFPDCEISQQEQQYFDIFSKGVEDYILFGTIKDGGHCKTSFATKILVEEKLNGQKDKGIELIEQINKDNDESNGIMFNNWAMQSNNDKLQYSTVSLESYFDCIQTANLDNVESVSQKLDTIERKFTNRDPVFFNDFGYGVDYSANPEKSCPNDVRKIGNKLAVKFGNKNGISRVLRKRKIPINTNTPAISCFSDLDNDKVLTARFAEDIENPIDTLKKEAELDLFLEKVTFDIFNSNPGNIAVSENFDTFSSLVSVQELQLNALKKRYEEIMKSFKLVHCELGMLQRKKLEVIKLPSVNKFQHEYIE